jgi:hypothetical protein
MPYEEKPFRSNAEATTEPTEVHIRMGHPRVRPHVVAGADKTGDALTKHDFVTSFLVAWQPSPTPPAHWVELLRQAPFGTQTVRASALHWDGRSFSIELLSEADIEAYGIEMPDWVDFANAEFVRRVHTPAEQALEDAKKRAEALENKLKR